MVHSEVADAGEVVVLAEAGVISGPPAAGEALAPEAVMAGEVDMAGEADMGVVAAVPRTAAALRTVEVEVVEVEGHGGRCAAPTRTYPPAMRFFLCLCPPDLSMLSLAVDSSQRNFPKTKNKTNPSS